MPLQWPMTLRETGKMSKHHAVQRYNLENGDNNVSRQEKNRRIKNSLFRYVQDFNTKLEEEEKTKCHPLTMFQILKK